MTEFVVQSAQEAAARTIWEHEILTLNEEASIAFAEMLLNPPAPNAVALAAAKSYQERFHFGNRVGFHACGTNHANDRDS